MVYESERILKTLRNLIDRAHNAGISVVYIQNNGGPADPDFPDTPGWQFQPELAPTKDEVVIQKETPNAFYRTTLQDELTRRGVKWLILAGMQTEYCVDTTCRQAFALDYQVTLVKDGHSTYDTKLLAARDVIAHHNAVLRAFAKVIDADELDFRAFLPSA